MPKFCHNCGKEAQPAWKACPYCETSFASLSSKPPVHTPQQPAPQVSVTHVDRGDDDDSYLDRATSLAELLRGARPRDILSAEIIKDRPVVETIGTVAAQPAPNVPDTFVRPAPYQNVDSQKFLEEFRKEAGTRGRTPSAAE
jgi:hypothetical protein